MSFQPSLHEASADRPNPRSRVWASPVAATAVASVAVRQKARGHQVLHPAWTDEGPAAFTKAELNDLEWNGMVGATGFEPAIFRSQSGAIPGFATPRRGDSYPHRVEWSRRPADRPNLRDGRFRVQPNWRNSTLVAMSGRGAFDAGQSNRDKGLVTKSAYDVQSMPGRNGPSFTDEEPMPPAGPRPGHRRWWWWLCCS